jgi:VanZ family protein
MNRATVTVRLPLLLWAAIMLAVSSTPGTHLPKIRLFSWDKLAHFGEYAVLAFLAARYFLAVRTLPIAVAARVAGVSVLLFAVADELHQVLIPNRTCSWQDLVADTMGTAVGLMVFILLRQARRTRWSE